MNAHDDELRCPSKSFDRARCSGARLQVSGDEAVQASQALARSEGIFTGTSGGGVLAVALRKARTLAAGSSMVVMLPDTGGRYLILTPTAT